MCIRDRGNTYKYQIVDDEQVLFQGVAATQDGAYNMAARQIEKMIDQPNNIDVLAYVKEFAKI